MSLAIMTRPHPAIKDLMSAVLILFGEQNLDWQNAKKYMADGNKFKKMILQFDKENVSDLTIKKL